MLSKKPGHILFRFSQRQITLSIFPTTLRSQNLPFSSAGRIVNITSVHGRFDGPRQSNYEVAKHGLETISDSLRMEMKKFGVHVSLVEPGQYGYMTSIENEDMVGVRSESMIFSSFCAPVRLSVPLMTAVFLCNHPSKRH